MSKKVKLKKRDRRLMKDMTVVLEENTKELIRLNRRLATLENASGEREVEEPLMDLKQLGGFSIPRRIETGHTDD